MKRYILKYSNGKIRQQDGLNLTFMYLMDIGVLEWIIDTKEGELWLQVDTTIVKNNITSYSASDLVIVKEENK